MRDFVRVFKALADENRLKVLELLREGDQCACDILNKLDITQPTLSHHMKILADSGVVKARKQGKWVYYSINQAVCEEVMKQLSVYCES